MNSPAFHRNTTVSQKTGSKLKTAQNPRNEKPALLQMLQSLMYSFKFVSIPSAT